MAGPFWSPFPVLVPPLIAVGEAVLDAESPELWTTSVGEAQLVAESPEPYPGKVNFI
jgi:hypothetical protein